MATEAYKALKEVTVHRKVGELIDPVSKTVLGIQQGLGRTVAPGEVISSDEISPILLEALEDENHPSHEHVKKLLVPADSKEATSGVAVPFAGYDDMEEEDIVSALRNLPSATISAVKAYERQNDNRSAIVGYSVGHGESSVARQTGAVGSPRQDPDEDKEVSKRKTREVVEDDVIEPGEGVTGTGDGVNLPDNDDQPKKVVRRSRRQRATQNRESGESGGSGSSE